MKPGSVTVMIVDDMVELSRTIINYIFSGNEGKTRDWIKRREEKGLFNVQLRRDTAAY